MFVFENTILLYMIFCGNWGTALA